jgi:hypothetical protein
MSGRLRFLSRFAVQTAPQLHNPVSVPGSPPAFIVSSRAPTTHIGWGTENLAPIQRLVNLLNQALYILSEGKLNFTLLFDAHFLTDLSEYSYLVMFLNSLGSFIYRQLLTHLGHKFTEEISSEQKQAIVNRMLTMLQNPSLLDGPINKFLYGKIGGDLKTLLENAIRLIKTTKI